MAEIGNMIIGGGVTTEEKERFFVAMDGSTIMLTEIKSSDSKDIIWDYMVIAVLVQDTRTHQPVIQIMPFTPYAVKANPNFPLLEMVDPQQIAKLSIEYSKIKTQIRASRSGIVTNSGGAMNNPKGMSLGNNIEFK